MVLEVFLKQAVVVALLLVFARLFLQLSSMRSRLQS
jgi:hypothetical protein